MEEEVLNDWARKGRSAEALAWRHLMLEQGQRRKHGEGRATAFFEFFEQVALARGRMGHALELPSGVVRYDPCSLGFSAQIRFVGIVLAARQCWLDFLLHHPPHALHLELRLIAKQMAEAARDEVPLVQKRDWSAGPSVVLTLTKSSRSALTAPTRHFGVRVVSHARKPAGKSTRLGLFKSAGAVTQKIAQTALILGGLRGVKCLGLPPTQGQEVQDTH